MTYTFTLKPNDWTEDSNRHMYCEDCKAMAIERENQVMDKAREVLRQEANAQAFAFLQKEMNPTRRKWKAAYRESDARLIGAWRVAVSVLGMDECARIVDEERERVYGHLPIGHNYGKKVAA